MSGGNPYDHVNAYLADARARDVADAISKAGPLTPDAAARALLGAKATDERVAILAGEIVADPAALLARGIVYDGTLLRAPTAYERACLEARRQIGCPCGLGEHRAPCPMAPQEGGGRGD